MPAHDVIREIITNEKDAKAKRIIVNWNAAEQRLIVEGWGHGIESLDKFMEILTDAKRLQKLAEPNVNISGEMGIGRLSALKLADKVVFESNNRITKSLRIIFDKKAMERDEDAEISQDEDRQDLYLDHTGVKVTLLGVKREYHEELLKADKELSETYAWAIITNQLQLIWNEKNLLAPSFIQRLFADNDYRVQHFEPTQRTVNVEMLDASNNRIKTQVNVEIEGVIEEYDKVDSNTGIIVLCQNGVKICNLAEDRKCRGIINTGNNIKLSATRNGYDRNDEGGKVFAHSLENILRKYDPIEDRKKQTKENRRTRRFNEYMGRKLGSLLHTLPRRIAKIDGIGNSEGRRAEYEEETREVNLLAREGIEGKTVGGILQPTAHHGIIDPNDQVRRACSSGVDTGGGKGGGINKGGAITSNPGTIRTTEVIPTGPDQHTVVTQTVRKKKSDSMVIRIAHTYSLPPNVFTRYEPESQTMWIGRRHPLHKEMFIGEGSGNEYNYLPHKKELFAIWGVRAILDSLPIPPKTSEARDQALDETAADVLYDLRKRGYL